MTGEWSNVRCVSEGKGGGRREVESLMVFPWKQACLPGTREANKQNCVSEKVASWPLATSENQAMAVSHFHPFTNHITPRCTKTQ